jgi:acyl-CoA synthetase (AMP-forming)/AMP-acid ligase II
MPFFWVGGLVTALLAASYAGASVICPANPRPKFLIEAAKHHDATHISLWPSQLRQIFDAPEAAGLMEQLRPTSAQQLGLFGFAGVSQTPNSLGLTETPVRTAWNMQGTRFLPNAKAVSAGRSVK